MIIKPAFKVYVVNLGLFFGLQIALIISWRFRLFGEVVRQESFLGGSMSRYELIPWLIGICYFVVLLFLAIKYTIRHFKTGEKTNALHYFICLLLLPVIAIAEFFLVMALWIVAWSSAW